VKILELIKIPITPIRITLQLKSTALFYRSLNDMEAARESLQPIIPLKNYSVLNLSGVANGNIETI